MIPHKPHVKKPMAVSPRDELVRAHPKEYLIRVIRLGQPEATTHVKDPGQALAAMDKCKEEDIGCLVYAIGEAYGEKCMALVDEEYLRSKM